MNSITCKYNCSKWEVKLWVWSFLAWIKIAAYITISYKKFKITYITETMIICLRTHRWSKFWWDYYSPFSPWSHASNSFLKSCNIFLSDAIWLFSTVYKFLLAFTRLVRVFFFFFSSLVCGDKGAWFNYLGPMHLCPHGFWPENPVSMCYQFDDPIHYSQHSERSPERNFTFTMYTRKLH